jgi:3-dehydroquinate dehydratase I
MTTRKRVKASQPQIVAVIASPADLNAAIALKQLPDLFELRLDSLSPLSSRLEKKIFRLRAPLIITARDPREGGIGKLSFEKRSGLLIAFLSRARYIDVELRSAHKFESLLARAQKQKISRILSYHNFKSTPTSRSLYAKARMARSLGADVFKVATRTDLPAAVARLIDFIMHKNIDLPVSAMGMGRLGVLSRLLLARSGSVLNYASLGRPNAEGQTSIALLRSALGR